MGQQLIARVKELRGCFDFIFPNLRPNRVKVFWSFYHINNHYSRNTANVSVLDD